MQTEYGYDDNDDSTSKIAEVIFFFLQQELDHPQKEHCREEAHNLLITNNNNTAPTTPPPPPSTTTTPASFLRRVCLESLRVTEHSIDAVRTVQKDVTVTVNNENNNNKTTVHIPEGSNLAFSHIIPNIAPSIWGGSSDETTPAATNTTPAVLIGTIRCVCIKTTTLLQHFPMVSTNVPDKNWHYNSWLVSSPCCW